MHALQTNFCKPTSRVPGAIEGKWDDVVSVQMMMHLLGYDNIQATQVWFRELHVGSLPLLFLALIGIIHAQYPTLLLAIHSSNISEYHIANGSCIF